MELRPPRSTETGAATTVATRPIATAGNPDGEVAGRTTAGARGGAGAVRAGDGAGGPDVATGAGEGVGVGPAAAAPQGQREKRRPRSARRLLMA